MCCSRISWSSAHWIDASSTNKISPCVRSEQYGKFMTFDEVNALTATPLDTSVSVSKWMEKAGAKCKTLAGDTLRCLGRVQDLEKAFGTKMYKFVHKETGRSVHKIDAEYKFPEELEGELANTPNCLRDRDAPAFFASQAR